MGAATFQTDEDSVRYRCPLRVFRVAVCARRVGVFLLQLLERRSRARARHVLSACVHVIERSTTGVASPSTSCDARTDEPRAASHLVCSRLFQHIYRVNPTDSHIPLKLPTLRVHEYSMHSMHVRRVMTLKPAHGVRSCPARHRNNQSAKSSECRSSFGRRRRDTRSREVPLEVARASGGTRCEFRSVWRTNRGVAAGERRRRRDRARRVGRFDEAEANTSGARAWTGLTLRMADRRTRTRTRRN